MVKLEKRRAKKKPRKLSLVIFLSFQEHLGWIWKDFYPLCHKGASRDPSPPFHHSHYEQGLGQAPSRGEMVSGGRGGYSMWVWGIACLRTEGLTWQVGSWQVGCWETEGNWNFLENKQSRGKNLDQQSNPKKVLWKKCRETLKAKDLPVLSHQ